MVNGVGGPGGAGKAGGVPTQGAPVAPEAAGTERARFGEVTGMAPGADDAARAERAGAAAGTSPFERLRSGAIDLPQYVELRVQEATAHLEGLVPPVDLEAIRAELREVVASDPDVAALARAAQIGS
jgi:hypothetical protein